MGRDILEHIGGAGKGNIRGRGRKGNILLWENMTAVRSFKYLWKVIAISRHWIRYYKHAVLIMKKYTV